jgi:magnesium chelatase subunit I
MTNAHPQTVGELRASGWTSRTVRDEMRANLVRKLQAGEALFPGIQGYEDTVVPQVVNAILARQDFILLGLRGQAKTRILRQLTSLLDPVIPALAGSEIHDDPFRPISKEGRMLVEERGDDAPIVWVERQARYIEKLATPDVTISDILGDVDPIKAARGGHLLSDELTLHYGLLPRANRGIFAINELPDLSGKIQVGLFNILQEGDVQIKGFPIRLPLDVFLVFAANPEDYTARGKIITPLKDRIGAEIRTHYPASVAQGMEISLAEAWVERGGPRVELAPFVAETVERVAFLARDDRRVDPRSGVSQRMPISVLEGVVSNAERRAFRLDEERAVPRISDIYAALPTITGKMELEYEGELQGAERIARELIARAAAETWSGYEADDDALDDVVAYFEAGGALMVSDDASANACLKGFEVVPSLLPLVDASGVCPAGASEDVRVAACELVLEALVAQRRIARSDQGGYRRPSGRGEGGASKGPGGFDPDQL